MNSWGRLNSRVWTWSVLYVRETSPRDLRVPCSSRFKTRQLRRPDALSTPRLPALSPARARTSDQIPETRLDQFIRSLRAQNFQRKVRLGEGAKADQVLARWTDSRGLGGGPNSCWSRGKEGEGGGEIVVKEVTLNTTHSINQDERMEFMPWIWKFTIH